MRALALTMIGMCSLGCDATRGRDSGDGPTVPAHDATQAGNAAAPGDDVTNAQPGGGAPGAGIASPQAGEGASGAASSAGGGGAALDAAVTQPPPADAGAAFRRRPPPRIPPAPGECPSFEDGTLSFGGLDGIQLVVGSKAERATAPLLVYWHGTGSSWAGERQRMLPSSVIEDIIARGGVIVAPDETTSLGENCSGTAVFHTGDIEVIDQLVACAVRDHNVDPGRIYTSGCSAGAFQAGCMAIERADYVAAVATNSGGLTSEMIALEDPARVPAAMVMYGVDTGALLIDFSVTSTLLVDSVVAADGIAVDCHHMGGHCGAPPELQEAAWRFLLDHPYELDADPYATGLPQEFPPYCERK